MSSNIDKHLETVDSGRRAAVQKLVHGATFAVPLVSSFAIQGKASIAMAGINTTAS